MRKRDELNEFAHLDGKELIDLINRTTLSKDDRIIAAKRLKWRMDFADIAALLHTDRKNKGETVHRTTISRRFKDIILPELRRIMHLDEHKSDMDCNIT